MSCFVGGNPIGPVWRGEIQCRALGMKVEVWDEHGPPVREQKGELVCTMPFPVDADRLLERSRTAGSITPPTSSASRASGRTATTAS